MMKTATTNLNGIDTEALAAMVEAIKADPAEGMTRWGVETEWQGDGPASVTRVTGWELGGEHKPQDFEVRIDEPRELLGKDAFANPQETLMAAMNACILATWVAACSVNGVKIESLSIETTGEIDLRGFLSIDSKVKPGYESMDVTVRIKSDATERQIKDIHEFVKRTSPNFDNLANPIRLNSRVELTGG